MVALRFLNAGESHGPELLCIVEGLPAGIEIDITAVDADLARRQRGFGSGGRMRIESDRARFVSGITSGKTTGSPIGIRVRNRDFVNWQDKDIEPMTIPRPGHADLVGALKYAPDDLRPSLERASARETTTRVVVGALCKALLGACGIEVGAYVTRIGAQAIDAPLSVSPEVYRARAQAALGNDLGVFTDEKRVRAGVRDAVKARDTLGGIIEAFAIGVPPGLGSFVHYDRRLDAAIAAAIMSVQAIKGVEFGDAFTAATERGTEVHDAIDLDEQQIVRRNNRAGGLEGGVSNGCPIVVRAAKKPIATTLSPQQSVDLKSGLGATTNYERSDFTAVPRAVVIVEAMLAFVLAKALLESVGGDTMAQVAQRTAALPRGQLADFRLHGAPFRFHYPEVGE